MIRHKQRLKRGLVGWYWNKRVEKIRLDIRLGKQRGLNDFIEP